MSEKRFLRLTVTSFLVMIVETGSIGLIDLMSMIVAGCKHVSFKFLNRYVASE